MNGFWRIAAGAAIVAAVPVPLAAQDGASELIGLAVMPADTFVEGPPSGEFLPDGTRGREPMYPSQPVQGFSAIRLTEEPNVIWALADNGFGTMANSPDYLLRLYQVELEPETAEGGGGDARPLEWIALHDDGRNVPFRTAREYAGDRLLTGSDFDVESFDLAPDGTIWVGEEFGPFLLNFSMEGELLAPPYAVPMITEQGAVLSPQHPALTTAGPQPGQTSTATVDTSGGFEGLAIRPSGDRLYAMLEKRVAGDPEGHLRIYEFDLATKQFTGRLLYYPLDSAGHAMGELNALTDTRFLVIERDNLEGPAAQTKRIYLVDFDSADEKGLLDKTLVVDLLNIDDPNGIGEYGPEFRFPYITVEAVDVIDERTLLVANDNNFRRPGGRSTTEPDYTEFIWLKLPKALSEY